MGDNRDDADGGVWGDFRETSLLAIEGENYTIGGVACDVERRTYIEDGGRRGVTPPPIDRHHRRFQRLRPFPLRYCLTLLYVAHVP